MQNYTTILGVITLREKNVPFDTIRTRFGIGNSTVQSILKKYEAFGISPPDLQKMNPKDVEELFYPEKERRRKDVPMPNFETIHNRMHDKKAHTTLLELWSDYRKENPDGYKYTQFCMYYKQYEEKHGFISKVRMAVNRVPGERVFIDWAGDTAACLFDRESGELKKVHVFVTTVGVSSKVYAEGFLDEKQASFTSGTVHALEYYGAIPKYLVPDNCKTAITNNTKDRLVVNASYQDLEKYYGTIVLPPPSRKPRGKPTVEKYVQHVENTIISGLRERKFYDLEQVNRFIKEKVEAINGKNFGDWKKSHNDVFEQYDKPNMKPLCDGHFSECDYKAFNSVPNNYHLKYDNHYYSVFYTYFDSPMILKATDIKIIICDQNNRKICEHQRAYKEYPKYITKEEHMPPHHLYYKEVNERNGDYYRRWAKALGEEMYTVTDRILRSGEYEEQMYNSCNGLLHSCDNTPHHIIKEAAKRCIENNCCTYTYFCRFLKAAKMNDKSDGKKIGINEVLSDHPNIWGKDYYK